MDLESVAKQDEEQRSVETKAEHHKTEGREIKERDVLVHVELRY